MIAERFSGTIASNQRGNRKQPGRQRWRGLIRCLLRCLMAFAGQFTL